MRNIFITIIRSLVFFSLCVTCGIDEIPILSMPEKGNTSETDDYFEFRILEKNGCSDCDREESAFRGFEIYYKFFSSTPEGQTAANTESLYETITELETHSFKRISYFKNNDDCDKPTRVDKPLIPVPDEPVDNRGKRSLVTISFAKMEDVYIEAEAEEPNGLSLIRGVTKLEIRRGIEDPDNEDLFKSFKSFKTTDSDVSGIANLQEEKSLRILLYVLSYGKYNIYETIYSKARCLSHIDIDVLILEE